MSATNKLVPAGHTRSATDCKAFAAVLAGVGDKWTILVIGVLSHGTLRYTEIQRRVGAISQRMLTLTLKRLEADGLVCRTPLPSIPPRVDYKLTPLGESLGEAVCCEARWNRCTFGQPETGKPWSGTALAPRTPAKRPRSR